MSRVRLSQFSRIALESQNAISASFAQNGGVTNIQAGTGISVNQSTGGVIITNTDKGTSTFPYTGSAIISGSLIVTGSIQSTFGFTGSLQGTASLALTASYIDGGTF